MSYALRVAIGDAGAHAIPNPVADPHIQWVLRYAPHCLDDSHHLVAAEIISGFDYLLSVPMKEATRRLRLLRAARKNALPKSNRRAE